MLVTDRRSTTNQEGEVNDVRFVKDGVARTVRTLRVAANPEPTDRAFRAGRAGVGADEPGASTTDVMLAGRSCIRGSQRADSARQMG